MKVIYSITMITHIQRDNARDNSKLVEPIVRRLPCIFCIDWYYWLCRNHLFSASYLRMFIKISRIPHFTILQKFVDRITGTVLFNYNQYFLSTNKNCKWPTRPTSQWFKRVSCIRRVQSKEFECTSAYLLMIPQTTIHWLCILLRFHSQI
jgi:hypothetical protein